MSDTEEEDPVESSIEDFSASDGDEWIPETKKTIKKSRVVSSSSESDSDDELIVKWKPNPIVHKVVNKKRENCASDSGSSGDDYLVDPNQLDIGSKFFQPGPSGIQSIPKPIPVFDCNAGLGQLSDSDSSNNEDGMQDVCSESNSASVKHVNLNQNTLFMLNLEKAKEHFSNLKHVSTENDSSCDVGRLLALGEANPLLATTTSIKLTKKRQAPAISTKTRKNVDTAVESDSDWEEVAEKKVKTATEDVVITVKPTIKQKKDRAQLDMEAQLKRVLNRRRKEVQMLMHKTHILCWIGHGNFLNSVINHPTLMELCLSFMPSKHTYPKDRTDLAYIEQISKWYCSQMKLKNKRMHPDVSWKLPPLAISLALQIRTKSAICKKMYVLMFIILLRAIGVQCRLVMNLVVLPIRPTNSELLPIAAQAKKVIDDKSSEVKNGLDKLKTSSGKKTKSINSKNVGHSSSARKDDNKATPSNEPIEISKKDSSKKNKLDTPSKTKGSGNSKRNKDDKDSFGSYRNKKLSSGQSQSSPTGLELIKSERVNNTSSKIHSASKSSDKSNLATPKPSSSSSSRRTSYTQNVASESKIKRTSLLSHVPSKASPSHRSVCKSPSPDISPHFPASKANNDRPPKLTKEQNSSATGKRRPPSPPVLSSPVSGRTRKRSACPTKMPHLPQLDGNDDRIPSSRKRPNLAQLKRSGSSHVDESEDSDYVSHIPRKRSTANVAGAKPTNKPVNKALDKVKTLDKRDRRLLSTDAEEDLTTQKQKSNHVDIWVEVYSEAEEQWMAVDLFKQKVHCIDSIRQSLTKPISYMLAWNNDNSIKDVSSRYCLNWNTVTRLQRVDRVWLDQALMPYRETPTFRTRAEDLDLNKIHHKEPLPKVIGEFKNHPLYALQRHLLKFEGIYPPDAPTLGFIRGEPIYARECVHTMHSREIWLKSARVVRPGQTAYKVVKARPKWDRHTNTCLEAQPLEIFGHWQTQPYDPPTAENGIVPRNAYGNVELFKPEMLPKKTVHLQLPALNRTCKKLNVDCASALVGFDYHSGGCHPTYDGFIVCEEFAELVVAQYWLDQEEAQRREEEKVQQRVYGNWKKLIRGLLIRQRLQRKYNFNESGGVSTASPEKPTTTATTKKSSSKRSRK